MQSDERISYRRGVTRHRAGAINLAQAVPCTPYSIQRPQLEAEDDLTPYVRSRSDGARYDLCVAPPTTPAVSPDSPRPRKLMPPQPPRKFGPYLRERRVAMGFSLRRFAELLDVSPTYLSRMEQEKTDTPPTVRLARRAAELLSENVDEMIALAGRMPEDLPTIIRSEPEAMPELLRAAQGLTAEKLRELAERARQMRGEEDQ